MNTYRFDVTLQGTGDTEEEAWSDAVAAFSNDPGDPNTTQLIGGQPDGDRVEVNEDGVYIFGNQKEIVCWVLDEVEEDAFVGLAIANAVKCFFREGAEALAAKIGKRWDAQKEEWVCIPDSGDGSWSPSRHITIAADSIERLRQCDVYRLFQEADAENWGTLRAYILQHRPDLESEVLEVIQDLNEEAGGPVAEVADSDRGPGPDEWDGFYFLVAEGWTHCFVGSKATTIDWCACASQGDDRVHGVLGFLGDSRLHPSEEADIKDSLDTNDFLDNPEDYDIYRYSWAELPSEWKQRIQVLSCFNVESPSTAPDAPEADQ